MDRQTAQQFAEDWIANWNRKDVQAVVGHFAEDAVFVSPRAAALTGEAVQRGKAALLAYWTAAVARIENIRFVLDRAVWDGDSKELLVLYTSAINGNAVRACELMRFGPDGKQVYGEALFGAAATSNASPLTTQPSDWPPHG